jgi:hypothetical protein
MNINPNISKTLSGSKVDIKNLSPEFAEYIQKIWLQELTVMQIHKNQPPPWLVLIFLTDTFQLDLSEVLQKDDMNLMIHHELSNCILNMNEIGTSELHSGYNFIVVPPLKIHLQSTQIPVQSDETPYLVRFLRLSKIPFRVFSISSFQIHQPEAVSDNENFFNLNLNKTE